MGQLARPARSRRRSSTLRRGLTNRGKLIRREHEPSTQCGHSAYRIGINDVRKRPDAASQLDTYIEVAPRSRIPRAPSGRVQPFDHVRQFVNHCTRVVSAVTSDTRRTDALVASEITTANAA